MAVTVYKDQDYQGVFSRLSPGLHSGRSILGCGHQSSRCEEIDNNISSLRVDANVIATIADGHALSANSGARVIVGPADITDLSSIGMDDKISTILVTPFREYDSAIPPSGGGVTLYSNYSNTGKRSTLGRGKYSPARLASEEVKMVGSSIVSLTVGPGTIAILYSGSNFDQNMDAMIAAGPTNISDVDSIGMYGKINSIRVLYTDPYDTPDRPKLDAGSARQYTPGATGSWGQRRRPIAPTPHLVQVSAPLPQPRDIRWKIIVLVLVFIIIITNIVLVASYVNKRQRSIDM